jgi:hypothetical protein
MTIRTRPIRTSISFVIGLGEIMVVALAAPIAILAVGLPLVLVIRLVLELIRGL